MLTIAATLAIIFILFQRSQKSKESANYICTVNVERFTGLNFHGFDPIKFLQQNFCGALAVLKHLNI